MPNQYPSMVAKGAAVTSLD